MHLGHECHGNFNHFFFLAVLFLNVTTGQGGMISQHSVGEIFNYSPAEFVTLLM